MGLITKTINIIWKFLIFFGVLVLIPGLPPDVSFTPYEVSPPPPLEGQFALNKYLDNAELLLNNAVKGPECFTILNGELYTTVQGGYVAKIVNDQIVPVVKFGQPCEGLWEESKCGRPLGIRSTEDGNLYVSDAYYGIFKYNIHTKEKSVLVHKDTVINGRKPKIFNSIDVAKDGRIYWTDSSSDFPLEDGFYTMFADGAGRLFEYNPKTKENKVLIDGLKFANGVALAPNEAFVIVAETFGSRLHRYYLTGPLRRTSDVFYDNLPGLPDNLRLDTNGNFLVPLVLPRDPKNPVLSQVLTPFPMIRKFLSRLVGLIQLPFRQLDIYYPNQISKRVSYFLANFEMLSFLLPTGTTLLEINTKGDVVQCYHSRDGRIGHISDVIVYNGYFYLGSPTNTYLARVRITNDVPYKGKVVTRETPTTTTTTTTQRPTTTTTTTQKPTTTTTTTQKPATTTTTTQKPTTTTTTTQKPTTTKPATEKPKPQQQQQQPKL